MLLGEADLVAVGLHAARLVAGRPDGAGPRVPQEQVAAPGVARHVLAPARHGDVAPAAVAGSRGRDHDRVLPVREQVRPRCDVVRGAEATLDGRGDLAHVGRALDLLGSRPRDKHVPGHALLQQELRRLDDRIRVKAPDHGVAVEDVADRHQRHPLVMCHVAVHDHHRRTLGQPPRRVVERLPEAVRSALRRPRPAGRSSGPPPGDRPWRPGPSRTGPRRGPLRGRA